MSFTDNLKKSLGFEEDNFGSAYALVLKKITLAVHMVLAIMGKMSLKMNL